MSRRAAESTLGKENAVDSIEPRVWALGSFRAGETAQIHALAELLGLPWVTKTPVYSKFANILALTWKISARGMSNRQILMENAWPDLVITASLRNEPICRWIQQASGGHTRTVFIGRCWAPAAAFDLVISTPQYRPRPAPTLLLNPLTLHNISAVNRSDPEPDRQRIHIPGDKPLIGVLIGGNSGPFVFNRHEAEALIRALQEFRRRIGGYFAITTSSRTPEILRHLLDDFVTEQDFYYNWHADKADNPFAEILARATSLVVTGDSVAMISEAIGSGKPVYIFDIPTDAYAGLSAAVYRCAMRWLPKRLTRDVELVHRMAINADWARHVQDANPQWQPLSPNYITPTLARVRGLLD